MHSPAATTMAQETLESIYFAMVTARRIDLIEQSYAARGEAFFHLSSSGHEGTAALAPHLRPQDRLHCHYRDKALMLLRGVPSYQFFLALFNKKESYSMGRQLNALMGAPEKGCIGMAGPVGNNALHAVGMAMELKNGPERPIVLCAMGDGTTQEGTVSEAIALAASETLPVLFLIEDNAFAISTTTAGKTFFSRKDGDVGEYYGVPIVRVDGRDVTGAYEAFGEAVRAVREDRSPLIVIFATERLGSHSNADDHRLYRTADAIEEMAERSDPVKFLRVDLLASGVEEAEVDRREEEIAARLEAEAKLAQRSAEPEAEPEAKRPLSKELMSERGEYRGGGSEDLTMLEAIRTVLDARLAKDPRVSLYGEDIEDPKGDVFGVTRGLSSKHPGRVVNSPLNESVIVGTSIGRALAGGRPVAFIQFADFLPIAYNQIFSDLGNLHWRTAGGLSAPVILMVSAGGYRPGIGPFHASTMEALAAHTPGVDVFMPSTAADAAGLLNAAFESERPAIFLYPKNQLNDRSRMTSADAAMQIVPIGKARTVRRGKDITIVGWGNTVPLAEKAAERLASEGVEAEVIDLRSISPWDADGVVASAAETGRLIVAHEDNHTAGFGAEVAATVAERTGGGVRVRRVTRPDTYVPCNFANQLEILPSYKRILEASVELLGGNVTWKREERESTGIFDVPASGSSPSDESVTVVEWKVKVGDRVKAGDLLAEVEADKAAAELKSQADGTVKALLVSEGDTVKVGTPIVRLDLASESEDTPIKPLTREDPGVAVISGLALGRGTPAAEAGLVAAGPRGVAEKRSARLGSPAKDDVAGIAGIAVRKGSRTVSNEEIARLCPSWTPSDIEKRVGIKERRWIGEGESVVSLAEEAAIELIDSLGGKTAGIDTIVFATGTPLFMTPSMAALLQHRLSLRYGAWNCRAYDLSAACTGYIYALRNAWEQLNSSSESRILVVTSEVLSPLVDLRDPGTAPIFGDAATATLLAGPESGLPVKAWVRRPYVTAAGESGGILRVPSGGRGDSIFMDGPKVYLEAVKMMAAAIGSVCGEAGLAASDVDMFVPHQANQRIINAVRQRLKVDAAKVYSNIRSNGNTSSSTIPICLSELLGRAERGEKWVLSAFGGGFTSGAALVEIAES